jgi:hypothetical protein
MSVVRGVVAAFIGCVLVALAGCGSSQYHYVKNSGDNVYFKIPSSWSQVDQGSLEAEVNGDPDSATAQVAREQQWVVAYDASSDPSVEHVLSVETPTDPIVFARVSQLTEAQLSQVSLDSLRNLFLPVTSAARQQAAAAGQAFDGFELIRDETLTSDGLRGVRSTYNYEISGGLQTFDLSAFVNDETGKVYMLLVRCSAKCYRERSAELEDIASSLTVKER